MIEPTSWTQAGRDERRRYERADLALGGRYMLTDRREYACRTVNISAGGIAILGPIKGNIGERVVAYVEWLGRVEGIVARQFGVCFAFELFTSRQRRKKIQEQLESLLTKEPNRSGCEIADFGNG